MTTDLASARLTVIALVRAHLMDDDDAIEALLPPGEDADHYADILVAFLELAAELVTHPRHRAGFLLDEYLAHLTEAAVLAASKDSG